MIVLYRSWKTGSWVLTLNGERISDFSKTIPECLTTVKHYISAKLFYLNPYGYDMMKTYKYNNIQEFLEKEFIEYLI